MCTIGPSACATAGGGHDEGTTDDDTASPTDDDTNDDVDDDSAVGDYAMCNCTENAQYFDCYDAATQNWSGVATGAEVLSALGVQFEAGKDLAIHFKYKATAGTNYNPPVFAVRAGKNFTPFFFPGCNGSGESDLTAYIPAGSTVDQLSFELSHGDWCAGVHLDSIQVVSHTGPIPGQGASLLSWPNRGFTLTAYWHDNGYELPKMHYFLNESWSALSNTVAVLNTWYQENALSNEIFLDADRTPPRDSVGAMLDLIHSYGLTAALFLYVDSVDGTWRGQFTPTDREAWFASLQTYLTDYAEFAETHNVEILSLGAEYSTMTGQPGDLARWQAIVAAVREVFTGQVIYAATQDNVLTLDHAYWNLFDALTLTFWADLSVEGETCPDVATLVARWSDPTWQNWHDSLETLRAAIGKDLFFQEIGYPSRESCAWHPWDWLSTLPYNGQCQANAYEAFFQVWGNDPHVQGAIFWQMEASKGFGVGDTSYNPIGKPAWNEVLHYFRGDTVSR